MTQPKSTSSSQDPPRTETTKNSSAEKKKLLQSAFKILQAEVYQNPRECDFRAGRTLVLLQELREFSDNPKAEQEREQVEPKKPTQISEEGCHWL